jgi:hypothetical protein
VKVKVKVKLEHSSVRGHKSWHPTRGASDRVTFNFFVHCLNSTISPISGDSQLLVPHLNSMDNASYNDCNRAFLQAFMARSSMTFEEAQPVLAAIFSAHGMYISLETE